MESKKELKWYKMYGHTIDDLSNAPFSNLVKTGLMANIVSYCINEKVTSGTSLYIDNGIFFILTDNFEILSNHIKNRTFVPSEEPSNSRKLLADVSQK
jgi:hypothetical protein